MDTNVKDTRMPDEKPKSYLLIYRALRGSRWAWRWRVTDFHNHLILGASTEGYSNRSGAVLNYARMTGVDLTPTIARLPDRNYYGWLRTVGSRLYHRSMAETEAKALRDG